MKKLTFTVALFLFMLNSCNQASGDRISTTRLELAQNRSDNNILFYLMGEEKRYYLKEIREDRSAPDVQKKADRLWNTIVAFDKETEKLLKKIHNAQINILKSVGMNVGSGENSVIVLRESRDEIRPTTFDFSKARITSDGKMLNPEEKKEIVDGLVNLRKTYSELLATSSSTDERKYSFIDPKISKYTNAKDLNEQVRNAIEKANVSPDDQDILRKIYSELTLAITFVGENMNESNDWLTNFEILSALEAEVLKSRFDAIMVVRSRVGGENYSFNKILTTTNGPAIVRKGEKITIEVCMAAYDSDRQPIVKTDNGTLIETKEGKGFVEISGDKPGYKTVKGTITIMNKSGIPKTLPWEKEIYVTD